MAWAVLILAGLFEAFGVAMLNQYSVTRNWKPIALFIVGFGASLALLSIAMRSIPMGTAYAIWTGIGVVCGSLIGMIFYNESKDWRRITCIAIVLSSTIGLKLIG